MSNAVRHPVNQRSKPGHLTAFDVTWFIMLTFETVSFLFEITESAAVK